MNSAGANIMNAFGCQSMVGQIKRVLVKHPSHAYINQESIGQQWKQLNYLSETDFEKACRDYDHFSQLLTDEGAVVDWLPVDTATGLDSIYTHDPVITTDQGVILCRMGKSARSSEPAAIESYCREMGIPILGRIKDGGLVEGGDVLWIDSKTVAVGVGYRTNAEGISQLSQLLHDSIDQVIPVPLPHWNGPAECLHLQSFISFVDVQKAVVYSKLMPVPFREYLINRGITLIEVPDEEYASMACNILATAPGRCIMIAGNPDTEQKLRGAGVHVITFDGGEICHKGAGGPTCLTRPIQRVV